MAGDGLQEELGRRLLGEAAPVEQAPHQENSHCSALPLSSSPRLYHSALLLSSASQLFSRSLLLSSTTQLYHSTQIHDVHTGSGLLQDENPGKNQVRQGQNHRGLLSVEVLVLLHTTAKPCPWLLKVFITKRETNTKKVC